MQEVCRALWTGETGRNLTGPDGYVILPGFLTGFESAIADDVALAQTPGASGRRARAAHRVQKGAGLIGSDRRPRNFFAAVALTAASLAGVALPAQAARHPAVPAPTASAAAAPDPDASVTLVRDGIDSAYLTHAKTVAAFLSEQGIVPTTADLVSPSRDSEIVDGERIEYRPAVAVTIVVGGHRRDVVTTASNVAALLAEEDVQIGTHDRVDPAPAAAVAPGSIVRVTRESVWTAFRHEFLPAGIRHRYDPTLPPGITKTVFAGTPGERELTMQYSKRDDGPAQAQLVASRVVRSPRAKIVLHGIGEYAAFARFAERGFGATLGLARSALRMIATAYTAGCYGCSGFTATGSRAGHGVVAVDPRIIPLGSRLFIPGYGHAIAGDTGGAIIGHRIDLGFNSLSDALRFGRRAITVYVLR